VVHQTFVQRGDGKRYTYDGISCMFRRYVKKCGLKDFGLYDLKGKAATDMYRAGTCVSTRSIAGDKCRTVWQLPSSRLRR
jgi:hypothetical protein